MQHKTAFIWNEYDELKYFVLDGDYREFNFVYVNSDHERSNDLDSIVFTNNGKYKVKFIELDELADWVRHGAYLVECGCLP